MNLCYLDCETTGLSPQANDIVQVAGIIEIKGEEVDRFNFLCQPLNYGAISAKALETNGRTIEELRTFEPSKDAFKKFISVINKYVDKNLKGNKLVMVGQNIPFDREFVKSWFAKMGYDNYAFSSYFDYRCIDIMSLNYLLIHLGLLDVPNIKLGTISDSYGIKIEKAHDAASDIAATLAIMKMIEEAFIKKPNEIDLTSLKKDSPLYQHISNLQEAYGKQSKSSQEARL